jgi:hypothetical protein
VQVKRLPRQSAHLVAAQQVLFLVTIGKLEGRPGRQIVRLVEAEVLRVHHVEVAKVGIKADG